MHVVQLQELLKDFDQPARVELVTIVPAEEPDKTEILFMSYDASKTKEDVPLSVEDLLDYIRSLNTNITVTNRVIHWDGRCHDHFGKMLIELTYTAHSF